MLQTKAAALARKRQEKYTFLRAWTTAQLVEKSRELLHLYSIRGQLIDFRLAAEIAFELDRREKAGEPCIPDLFDELVALEGHGNGGSDLDN
jgi:hypothetical protein